jgi:FSR family fosmidomycin resistance protein-like MFS transporter
VLVVLGQEYLPKRIGIASGVTLGLAVTIGGLAAPLFGYIGDHYGLIAVFGAIVACGLVALLASLALPKPTGVERA